MNMLVPRKNLIRIALVTALLLLVPGLAMVFTAEVRWSPADFAVAGVLLAGTGLLYELAARHARTMAHRLAVGVAVATALLLIWVNLAVGIIGAEGNPANLMYLGVLAVGLGGALVARFQPAGMKRAMFATALAQALVAGIALAAGFLTLPVDGRPLLAQGLFVVLWLVAGLLFGRAAVAVTRSGGRH